MKKLLLACSATALIAGASSAEEIKIGIILGYTGPLESIMPTVADAAEMAINEVNASGALLNGSTVIGIRGDDGCVDSGLAVATAERLVTGDGVKAIVGGDCSGVTGAILQNVAMPNGIVMISPSATSPGLSHNNNEDQGLFFRTSPSDARQGVVVSEILNERGIKSIALTYVNADYGLGLANSIQENFEASGGTVTISAAHEDGKADYSAEVAALAAAGGEVLVVAGYADGGGKGIIQASLDAGAFDTFYLPDGMVGTSLLEAIGEDLNGSFGANPESEGPNVDAYRGMASAAGFDGVTAFSAEGYDAAALIMLAMQAAGSSNSSDFASHVMDVANAPGEKILPGELGKALALLKNGVDIDYVGASGVELVGPGESGGVYRQFDVNGGQFVTVQYR
jgi:branched-chain amino acid transport system substrate-binding protein